MPTTINKNIYWLISCIVFCLIALYLDFSPTAELLPQQYTPTINAYLRAQEAEAKQWVETKDFVQWQYLGFDKAPADRQKELYDKVTLLDKKPYTIFFYRGDSLIFWTNTKTKPEKIEGNIQQSAIVSVGNVCYERIYYPIAQLPFKNTYALVFIPIQYKYPFESNFFKDEFAANANIPTEFAIQPEPSPATITAANDQPIGYLHGKVTETDRHSYRVVWMLLAYLASFFSFCTWLDRVARNAVHKTRAVENSVILPAAIFVLILLATYFNFTARFSSLGLFKRNFENTTMLGNSLGDLLINIILLVWLMIFFSPRVRHSSVE
jgi:two-component system, NtrC family, nitrogen regulation sensor histidine kinase NtrY